MSTVSLPREPFGPFASPGSPEQISRGHRVQFYADDEFLVDSLSRLVEKALAQGGVAFVICTEAHGRALSGRMQLLDLDLSAAAQQGRYVVLDASETLAKFMVNGTPDDRLFSEYMGGVVARAAAAAEAGREIFLFGEMVSILWLAGRRKAALDLEHLWNELGKKHAFLLHCAYPMQAFGRSEDGESFQGICSAHTQVVPSEDYTGLSSENERLRNITHLQQKAQALETEAAARKHTQEMLKRRESELAELLENAIEGAQQVGPDRRVLWANRALLKLLGYTASEYVSHSLTDFCTGHSRFEEFWRRLMQREDIYDYPLELQCKDGSVKHFLINSNGLWQDGTFVHTRCFLRDVTEQKRAEEALRENEARLRQAKAELEEMVEQRTAALRQLSLRVLNLRDTERRRIARDLHDSLGQYLVGLKLSIDMLKRRPTRADLWAESEKLMEQCIVETRTMSYLLHPPTLEAAGLASAVRWYVDGFSKRSAIQVTLEIAPDLDRLPDTIEFALFRVLQEGLTNVHRHSGAESAEIHVLRDAEQVILEVKDSGRGIQPELLTHFHKSGIGMGVGLTGVRERVRELGGQLALQSDSQGTCLTVAIPVAGAVD